jgi:hypothetical protein
LKNAQLQFQSQYNEEIDEAKEDRRSQIVDYLVKNPGATVADMGRAIWNRDVDTLGRNSSLVITIVRSISSALKAGVIRRDDSKKPYKYYTTSASGKGIGSSQAPVKQTNSSDKRFDAPYIESRIKALASKGYIVKKTRQEPDGSWYYKIQKPENANNDIGTGIGYTAFEYKTTKPKTDYFYHNSHGSDDNKLGNVWNRSKDSSGNPGPGGWYTFDQKYIEQVIDNLASQNLQQAPVATPKKVDKEDVLSIINKEWPYGNWQGGPKYFDFETKDRGPRTDHGGGEDGDDWMDDEQIRQARAPYVKKWGPRLEQLKTDLKKYGIQAEAYVDYGEKGHVTLQLTIK